MKSILKNIFLSLVLILIFPCYLLNAQEAATQQAATPEPASPDMQIVFKTTEKVTGEDILKQKISLDLRNIDIVEALKFLATKTGLNIVTTKSVTGRVTLTVENVPIQDIFDIMLRGNSLAYDKKGEIYSVMTEAEYKTLYGKTFFDTRQVKVMRLKYAIPEQAFSLLDALKSDIGKVLVDSESGNVLIMDTPEKISLMQQSLEEFEKKNVVEVFTLKYAKAKEVEETLKTQLDTKKVGYIKADERTNQVMVQTLPERMEEIKRLIKNLDGQTREVLIDTKIIKIKLSDTLDSDLEWEGIFSVARKYGMTYVGSYPYSAVQASAAAWRSRSQVLSDLGGNIGSYPFSGTTSDYSASTPVTPGESLHIGTISSNRDYDVFVKYLQTLGSTKILSNPKLVVVNNQEAKIHVGERQAYVTTTTTTGQTTSAIAEQVTFVDVGIQLSVTPTINEDGYITMKVKPEISSVVSTLTTPTKNEIPIIDTSMAETTVLIKDGTTLIIGGLRKEEKTRTADQFPFLGKIPLLGFFFKTSSNRNERTELLVMLTPHIISGESLTTGDEREFSREPGKEYRDYQGILPKEQPSPYKEPTIEEPREIKPYQDYGGYDGEEKDFLIKEKKYGRY
jgi:type II secretory pathway component GspD/PulD (secretin)